ncbi:MAG: hypothetical protein KDA41_19585 [Planctomycetales bacterium]|nr:hypothetical protein [Planctomycetales bacterium]
MAADSSNSQPAAPTHRLEWEPLTPMMRKRLQVCFDHAQKLSAAGGNYDFDYASDMLSQCISHDPGNFVYVDAFLENLYRKYKNNRRGGGGAPSRSALKKAITKKEWAEVLTLSPAFLAANPWDVATLRPLAEACAAFGFNDVELRYLKSALDANPKDIDVNKHCAATLERVGQFDQAIACWRRIGELRKGEPEVDRKISQLTLDKTRALSGLGEDEKATGRMVKNFPGEQPAEQTADAPAAPAPAAPAPKRQIELTERQKLERALSDDETNV